MKGRLDRMLRKSSSRLRIKHHGLHQALVSNAVEVS